MPEMRIGDMMSQLRPFYASAIGGKCSPSCSDHLYLKKHTLVPNTMNPRAILGITTKDNHPTPRQVTLLSKRVWLMPVLRFLRDTPFPTLTFKNVLLSKTGKRYGKKKSNHHFISGKDRRQKGGGDWEEEEMTHECNKWDTLYHSGAQVRMARHNIPTFRHDGGDGGEIANKKGNDNDLTQTGLGIF